jgi:hypothetical protein
MYRPCIPRFSEADAREITSNLSTSFMAMDSAGILRPKIVEGSTAPIAAYLINNQPTPNDLMAPVHWVALESLGIISTSLRPEKINLHTTVAALDTAPHDLLTYLRGEAATFIFQGRLRQYHGKQDRQGSPLTRCMCRIRERRV